MDCLFSRRRCRDCLFSHAVATINLRADHIISGTVINLMAPALGVFLVKLFIKRTNRYDYTIIWLFFFPRIVKNSSDW